MRRFISASLVVAFTLAFVPLALAEPAIWELDPSHSSAHFSVRHLMISNVQGEFSKISGTLTYDGKDVTKGQIDVTIDASSINTRDAKRDTHLKSADFLDVAKFPTITFRSKKVTKVSATKVKITGDLNIHGVTKEVVLDATLTKPIKDPWGNTRMGTVATTKFDRKDFGLTWNKSLETGGVLVGDAVTVTIDAEFMQKTTVTP